MTDNRLIHFPVGNACFTMRAAGIAWHGSNVLLHKSETDVYWCLPGGRVELFEFSKETLLREFKEETGLTVIVGDLLSVSENFFSCDDVAHHEIGFYYQIHLPETVDIQDFRVQDGDNNLLFRWINISEIAGQPIYPAFVKDLLLSPNGQTEHFTIPMQNLQG